MLGLSMPTRITASGGLYHYAGRITTPDTLSVHFEFEQAPVHRRRRLWGATEYDPEVNNGCLSICAFFAHLLSIQCPLVLSIGRRPRRR